MIIVYNRNTSTRNPGSDETDIFRRESPTRIRAVKTYVVQLPSLTTVPGDQRPGIYYSGINTHIIYYSGVRSRHDPTDFPEFETDFD